MAKDDKKQERQEKKKKKSKLGGRLLMSFLLLSSIILLPSSILLTIGMLPTFVAGFIVKTNRKSKVFTVGAMNLAGCSPLIMDLWSEGHTIEKALNLIMDPMSIIIMYTAAAIGYMIYWSVVGVVSGVLYQKALAEKARLEQKMEDLEQRWGKEVTGKHKLDEHGFASEELVKSEAQEEQTQEQSNQPFAGSGRDIMN